MAVELEPLTDKVIVLPNESANVTAKGIIIPDSAKERALMGTVVSIGPGKYTDGGLFIPTECKVGDEVLYGHYAGTEVKLGTMSVLVMRESEIFSKVKRTPDVPVQA